ncbi:unnamed protein product [Rotaria socialis]|uniref:Nuclear receptor domain-containing protein n=1 Tax=Rotaria socialis TaxID=392032 RepID=A0A818DZ28_9BILA|nr:unnamed protein product [Rotaria socialis]CAF3455490.1 unnamed protein product [Rotaria socialis]
MLICNFYGQCEISMKNRHACPACRLAKCFKWGMTTDKFRPSRQIKPKTIISLRLQARCQPERDLTNPIHILEIQNKYAEVAWKYLLYRYCYRESVKRFLNLIIWLTSINILLAHARTLVLHVNDIDCVIEQTELTFILDDVDEIVERNE